MTLIFLPSCYQKRHGHSLSLSLSSFALAWDSSRHSNVNFLEGGREEEGRRVKCFAAIPFLLSPRSTLHARYRFKCFFSRSPPLSCSTYVHVHTLPSAAYVEQGPFYTRVCTSFGLEAILPSRNRNQFQKSPNRQFASFVSSFFKAACHTPPPQKITSMWL